MENAYKNISYFFGAFVLLIFVAFFRTYFGLFPGFTGIATLIHVHVVANLIWFALLIVQPVLIFRKKVRLHRMLGKLSYGFVPFMLLLLVLVGRSAQLREKQLDVFAVNIFDVTLFAVLYGLAITYRRNAAYHARFMIMTVLPFLGASFARLPEIPMPPGGPYLLVIGGLLLYERFHGKVYKPYVISLFVFLGLFIPLLCLFLFGQPVLNVLWEACFG